MYNAETLHSEAECGQLAIIRERIFSSYTYNSGKTYKLDKARIETLKKQFQESMDALSEYYGFFYTLNVMQGDETLFTLITKLGGADHHEQ